MRLLSVSLLVVALVTSLGATAAAQPALPETGLRRIELHVGASGAEPEIHIRPGVSTVLTFDVKLAREPAGRLQMELERPAAFTQIDAGDSVLRLVPSAELKPGDRLRLTVHFNDGMAPPEATVILVVIGDRADRLVEVFRAPRPVESFPPEMRAAWAAVRQCQDALARAQAATAGLTALRNFNVLADSGVVTRNLADVATRWQHGAFTAKQLRTYRAERRVLVELSLRAREPGALWTARNASLAGPGGELLKILSVWQDSPVTTDAPSRVLVEAESDETLSPESWTLWLSEDGGGRALVLGGIAFAPME
ncbi:DUF2381 family protein [Pyxidicoccus caerfyrddinensis]|uniref:DUF2381 family protein n=1 Tax=Pyxidicoccus caerfyrddinensis TaxID=2709663 RepID=UPI0013DC9C94|nr:DUF2381 family protein [Pyxidicoccus caerfyrddinensis]